jgi:hypothetical protein
MQLTAQQLHELMKDAQGVFLFGARITHTFLAKNKDDDGKEQRVPKVQVLVPSVIDEDGEFRLEPFDMKVDELKPGHMDQFLGQELILPVKSWAMSSGGRNVNKGYSLNQILFAKMYPFQIKKGA